MTQILYPPAPELALDLRHPPVLVVILFA